MIRLSRFIFPVVMIAIMIATIHRYNTIREFKKGSSEHSILVEAEDIESLERAVRNATFQDMDYERISGGGYRIVLRCPPEKLASIIRVMQRSGAKQIED